MSSVGIAAPSRAETLTFDSKLRGPDLVGLSFKNVLLNIVTLSFYRFWAKTEVRRRIWAGVTLNDEAFEYTGRGMELFKGFLIAAVVLGVPLVILSFLAQLLGPLGAIMFTLVFYVGLFALIGFATFTSFRYRASRTTWRGIRFELTGSAVSYGAKYLGLLLLTAVSLGWFWPAAQRRLAGDIWGALRFGDRALRFDLDAAREVKVYKLYAVLWAVAAAMYVIIGAVSVVSTPDVMAGVIIVASLVALPFVAIAGSAFQAAMLRSIAAGVRLEGVRFKMHASWADLLTLWVTNFGIIALSFGILTPVAEMRRIRFAVQRLKAVGDFDLSAVRQGERGAKTGEGLADILDLAAI